MPVPTGGSLSAAGFVLSPSIVLYMQNPVDRGPSQFPYSYQLYAPQMPYARLAMVSRKNIQEASSKCRFSSFASPGEKLKVREMSFAFSLLSSPVWQGVSVILWKTQSNASRAICLCVAENMPIMPKTINAIKQKTIW